MNLHAYKATYLPDGTISLTQIAEEEKVVVEHVQKRDAENVLSVSAHWEVTEEVAREEKEDIQEQLPLPENSFKEQQDASTQPGYVTLSKPRAEREAQSKRIAGLAQHDVGVTRSKVGYTAFKKKLKERFENMSPKKKLVFDGIHFGGTFVAIFFFLFTLFNAPTFLEFARSRFFAEERAQRRSALEQLAGTKADAFNAGFANTLSANVISHGSEDHLQPESRAKLLSIPELPVAGPKFDLTNHIPDVFPVDNRIVIPKIGKNVPMVGAPDDALNRGDWKTFEKDIQDALRFGVVHYPGTAVPGQAGNVFLTGHSSYNFWDGGDYKEVFALLGDLDVGDEYAIFYEGELHKYRITDKFEVSPRDVTVLDQPPNRLMSTLMTCTPLGTNLRRLILRADEIDPVTGEIIEVVAANEIAEGAPPIPTWSGELVGW